MSTASNLYAEKVFSEHPLLLWPLDDKVDYLSLISESQRNVSTWQITGGTSALFSNVSNEPFPGSTTTRLTGSGVTPGGSSGTSLVVIDCVSSEIANFTDLDQDLATFSIGAYFYAESPYIDGFEIGYSYYDTTQGQNVIKLKSFTTSVSENWIFVSETFDIPPDNANFKIFLRVRYLASEDSVDPYNFLVNGVSLGQWSEEFNSTSLGVSTSAIPSDIFPSTQGIVAASYGLQEANGYYLANSNYITAQNSGVPMVYGASNVTILSENENKPSLILPGKGFLNELGRYKDYTYEMWLRITSDTKDPKRIFGPIRSDDGLYVEGSFIKLKIGDNIGSHYIGEWCRPMIVHVRVVENFASLLINGEQVISLSYETADLDLPLEYSGGLHNDWIGFYAYTDVPIVEVDAVAIYPYSVPAIVAKRRFVYGQGVEFPENINAAYSGTSIYIDYPFADYTNNYSYPDTGNWRQGVLDNAFVQNNILSAPEYELPDLVFESIDEDTFFEINRTNQSEDYNLISFNPTGTQTNNGYMLFDTLNILLEDTKVFYGIFKAKSISSPQTLFLIENEITKENFEIELDQGTIRHKLKTSNGTSVIYEAFGYEVGEMFTVGINIDNFSLYYGARVAEFFGNKSQLKVYVGGYKDFSKTFSGNIYKIGFCNERNYEDISHLFNTYGITLDYENVFNLYNQSQQIDYDAQDLYFENGGSYYNSEGELVRNLGLFWDYVINGGDPSSFTYLKMMEHTASYTLIPKVYFDNLILDIAVKGSWQDYLPLTYFAQYVTDSRGKRYYDLDFLQFNVDYPAPSSFVELESATGQGWTYEELQSEYGNPVQQTYASLDNHLYTGYNDYNDLKNKSVKNYIYDTSSSIVKTSVTFQYTETGANSPDSYFINYVGAQKDGIVEPKDNWINTEYEVVDNMLIYPPLGANFEDISVVVNIKFENPGIINNPVKIKKLALCSQAFNQDTSNPVGTRFGTPIYPYTKSGLYFDYKSRNPFTIYKSSSPYLYLTRYSGIQVRGQYNPLVNRGLSAPINQTKADNYKVIAMQAAIRYDQDFFPYAPTQIFEIQSKNSLIKFYMVSTHPDGKRAKIYAINANTGRVENGISFYLNGLLVRDPTINIKQWAFLGISFANTLDFSQYAGAFRINGPLLVNTISHYQSTNLQEVQKVSNRPWFRVKLAPPLVLDWHYWDAAYIWQGVLVISTTSYYGVDPADIYKTYSGTNKIIVSDPTVFRINNYKYPVIKNVSWQSTIVNAV